MNFEPTPEGFEQARAYAQQIGLLDKFESIKDSYLQLHMANQWYNDENER